jgi:hypothetical protein
MSLQLAYNTTDAPVTVDSAGFQIGGRSWGVVDSTDDRGKAELAEGGALRRVDEDKARASETPAVKVAVADLDRRRELAEAAKAASKEDLVEALPAEVVDGLDTGGDGLPAKADLEDAAIASGEVVEPAPKSSAKKTASRSAAK